MRAPGGWFLPESLWEHRSYARFWYRNAGEPGAAGRTSDKRRVQVTESGRFLPAWPSARELLPHGEIRWRASRRARARWPAATDVAAALPVAVRTVRYRQALFPASNSDKPAPGDPVRR